MEILNKKPPSSNASYSDAVVNSVDEMVVNAGIESKPAIEEAQISKQKIISYDLAQDRVSPDFPPQQTKEVVTYDLSAIQSGK